MDVSEIEISLTFCGAFLKLCLMKKSLLIAFALMLSTYLSQDKSFENHTEIFSFRNHCEQGAA